VDKKIILWSIALFFGSYILFQAVHDATAGQSTGVRAAAQAGALILLLVVVITLAKRRSKP
jgi:hypothetical protein